MDRLRVWTFAAFGLLSLGGAVPPIARAQVIPIKTVPVASGDQFAIFPSDNAGMGVASIALNDTLLDPFVNPAKGRWIRGAQLFAAPMLYDVSGEDGSARTLGAGSLHATERWFGGIALALQEMTPAARPFFGFTVDAFGEPLSESADNTYAFGMLGARLPDSRFSIGASAFWADLGAVEGVEYLYGHAQKIDQFGHAVDVRLGLLGEWEGGRTLEALLLYSDLDMTHDVTYLEPVVWREWSNSTSPTTRVEHNRDQTRTWGVHLGAARPVGQDGWRIGGILTGNWKSHPKLPNYELLMNIPKDPGSSTAYNVGLGLAQFSGSTTFAVDLVYEPAWVRTWALAGEPLATAGGDTIAPGTKTVDNEFRFSNAGMRIGLRQEDEPVRFQVGIGVRSIRYRMEQKDFVAKSKRTQRENWTEWTPTWGLSVRFSELEVRYFGRVALGVGRPGVTSVVTGTRAESLTSASSDFLPAPSGRLRLDQASVWTHQVTLSIPLER